MGAAPFQINRDAFSVLNKLRKQRGTPCIYSTTLCSNGIYGTLSDFHRVLHDKPYPNLENWPSLRVLGWTMRPLQVSITEYLDPLPIKYGRWLGVLRYGSKAAMGKPAANVSNAELMAGAPLLLRRIAGQLGLFNSVQGRSGQHCCLAKPDRGVDVLGYGHHDPNRIGSGRCCRHAGRIPHGPHYPLLRSQQLRRPNMSLCYFYRGLSSSAFGLKWFKGIGATAMNPTFENFFSRCHHRVYGMGYIARMTRASMAEVMTAQYIRTARLKGVSWQYRYETRLRNALIAPFTVIMLQFPGC